jgi:hypothetical protein
MTNEQTYRETFIHWFRDLLWVSVGQYFIFGALCPSKSGLMNKHIVVWFGLVGFSFNASLEPQPRARRRARLAEDAPARNAFWTGPSFLGVLYPSKSGLINKKQNIPYRVLQGYSLKETRWGALVGWWLHHSRRRGDCSHVLTVCIQATSLKSVQGVLWRVAMSLRARCFFFPTHETREDQRNQMSPPYF